MRRGVLDSTQTRAVDSTVRESEIFIDSYYRPLCLSLLIIYRSRHMSRMRQSDCGLYPIVTLLFVQISSNISILFFAAIVSRWFYEIYAIEGCCRSSIR